MNLSRMLDLSGATLPAPTSEPPSWFDTSIAAAYDEASYRAFLPPDVTILCADGGTCEAHRFVLVFQSEFFRCKFRHCDSNNNNNNNSKGASTVELVDLSGYKLATSETMNIVIQYLYKGQSSIKHLRLNQVFDLLYASNYMLLPRITDFCVRILDRELSASDPKFVMHVYHVAEELSEKDLISLALRHIMLLEEEPEDFCKVSANTMAIFLKLPEAFKFRSLTGPCRMPALRREKYLLDVLVRFIKYDKESRLQCAHVLFAKLRLPYIVKDLDFDTLGLPELKNKVRFRSLHNLLSAARLAATAENIWLSSFVPSPSNWLPRPGSIKYSLWSKRFGDLKYLPKKEDASPAKFGYRRITSERNQDHRLTGILVYPMTWEGQEIIGGIKLRWSDGTEDEAGHVDEACKEEVVLRPYSGVLVELNAGQFINRIKFYTCERGIPFLASSTSSKIIFTKPQPKIFGPFGCKNLDPHLPFDKALGNFRSFEDICYLDGLKCTEVTFGESKLITSVKFKLSLMVNLPLDHLTAKNPIDIKEPSWGVSSLEKSKSLKSMELKRAFKAATSIGYGRLGLVSLFPDPID